MDNHRERKLASSLLREVRFHSRSTKRNTSRAALLWKAAHKLVPLTCVAVMSAVEKDFPAKKRAPHHLAELFRRLDTESDLFIDQTTFGGAAVFPDARALVEEFALRNLIDSDDGTRSAVPPIAREGFANFDINASKEEIFSELRDSSNALQEAARALKIDLRAPQQAALPPMNRCDVCWRTGFRGRRNAFLCSQHQLGTSAYQKALRLRYWRDTKQPQRNYSSYQLTIFQQIDPTFISGADQRYGFPESLLSHGQIEKSVIPLRRINLRKELARLPFVVRFVEQSALRSFASIPNLAPELLRILDPVHLPRIELHKAMHRAALRDQRILLHMMWIAESWLATEYRIKHCNGQKAKVVGNPRTIPLRLRR